MRQNITRGLVVFAKVIGVPLVGYVLFLGYQGWQTSDLPAAPLQAYGLSASLEDEDTSVSGAVYFSAQAIHAAQEFPYFNVIRYQLENDVPYQLTPYPGHSFSFANDEYVLMIGPDEASDDPDLIVPLWFNQTNDQIGPLPSVGGFFEEGLTVAPGGALYAYAYQDAAGLEPFNIQTWNIALHNFESGDVVTIPNASEPHFFNEGADLAFMRADGIYRYHLATGAITPLYQAYKNLTAIDDYAISPDSTTLILAAPVAHVLSVARTNKETQRFQEVGVHLDSNYRYRHPVISPNSRMYAVVAVEEASFDAERSQHTNAAIEFRMVNSRELIDRLDVESYVPTSVTLDAWLPSDGPTQEVLAAE